MRDDIPDVEAGEDILADWGNQVRDMAAARDIGDSYQGVPSGGYHSWRRGASTKNLSVRYGILRTDLEAGGSCIIEEREWTLLSGGNKYLKCNGKTYRAFDPIGEFYGTADEACVEWFVDANGPSSGSNLDALNIDLPAGAPTPTETEIGSIRRITCPGFVCECPDPPEGLCSGSCVYIWRQGVWEQDSADCSATCYCPEPDHDGSEEGEVEIVICVLEA